MQAAINAALSQLPTNLPSNPTYRKVNPADAPIMIITLTSDIYTQVKCMMQPPLYCNKKLSQIEWCRTSHCWWQFITGCAN